MKKSIVLLFVVFFFYPSFIGMGAVTRVGNFTCLDYPLLFWNFHIHTSFSNRKGTDLDHRFAPDLNRIYEFCHAPGYGLIGLDHGELLSQAQWILLGKKSDELSRISRSFVRGFEWTSGGVFDPSKIDFAHIGVVNTKHFAGSKRITPDCGADVVKSYILMWEWLNDNLGAKGSWGFAHPWIGSYQFADFELSPFPLVNQRCYWIEVAGGPQNVKARDGLKYYIRALQKGWKVSPVYGSDNFAGFGASEVNNFAGIIYYDLTGSYPGTTHIQLGFFEIKKHRVYTCEVGGKYGVYFLDYFTLRDGSKVVMGDTVSPRVLRQVKDFTIDTTMEIRDIKEIQYHLIYPNDAKNIVVKNARGNFDDSKVVKALREKIPLAFFVCLVDKGDNYVVASPIWFERANP